mmetsp:Transcript_14800/g.24469  ORF Transcript_14800/g.24469 Transcript_14800/m.24469 type:complete len:308 (-) Transcript_14800:147-1070(-)
MAPRELAELDDTNNNNNMKANPAGSPFSRMMRRRRRSTSAPPSTTKRRLVIEDHYRTEGGEGEARVVLPGVPTHEDDWARDAHDFFNLIVLIPLVVLNIMNWNWDMLLLGKSPEHAWTGEWFFPFYIFAQSYFVADLGWMFFVPSCVRSPTTIIQHHVATILYMMIPYFFPEFRFIMGALLSVEINTWFLIARRVFNKQGFQPWIIGLPPILSIRIKLISICFYVTWVVIRCIIYPLLIIDFVTRYNARSAHFGTRFNIWAVILPLHSCFVALNFKWTYDLLMSKLRYWRRSRGKGGAKKEDISKGL